MFRVFKDAFCYKPEEHFEYTELTFGNLTLTEFVTALTIFITFMFGLLLLNNAENVRAQRQIVAKEEKGKQDVVSWHQFEHLRDAYQRKVNDDALIEKKGTESSTGSTEVDAEVEGIFPKAKLKQINWVVADDIIEYFMDKKAR